MRKLILTASIAAFTLSCSPADMQSDYETEIQTIDKDEAESPRDIKTKDKN